MGLEHGNMATFVTKLDYETVYNKTLLMYT